jgi:hypothetical protein
MILLHHQKKLDKKQLRQTGLKLRLLNWIKFLNEQDVKGGESCV